MSITSPGTTLQSLLLLWAMTASSLRDEQSQVWYFYTARCCMLKLETFATYPWFSRPGTLVLLLAKKCRCAWAPAVSGHWEDFPINFVWKVYIVENKPSVQYLYVRILYVFVTESYCTHTHTHTLWIERPQAGHDLNYWWQSYWCSSRQAPANEAF